MKIEIERHCSSLSQFVGTTISCTITMAAPFFSTPFQPYVYQVLSLLPTMNLVFPFILSTCCLVDQKIEWNLNNNCFFKKVVLRVFDNEFTLQVI